MGQENRRGRRTGEAGEQERQENRRGRRTGEAGEQEKQENRRKYLVFGDTV
jgi:hypothetical protein